MTEQDKPNYHRWIYACAPTLVAVYILSFGPVTASFSPRTPAEAAANVSFFSWFYAPLGWLGEIFPPFVDLLFWYAELFRS